MSSRILSAARRVVDELTANDARLHYRPSTGSLPASFTYELAPGGDRRRCRGLIAEAKADPQLWAAMLREIALRSEDRDHAA